MSHKNKLLTVLSDAEHEALYGLPDFDDRQQLDYLSLSEAELALAMSRPDIPAQVYCVLQIGYFKAKQAFFRYAWDEADDDTTFVLSRYFQGEAFDCKRITDHEHYTQRRLIAELLGYQLWSREFLAQLAQQAAQIVRRDAGFRRHRTDRLAQRAQDRPARIHHAPRTHQRCAGGGT